MTGTAQPEFADAFAFRVRGTLEVDELHRDLQESCMLHGCLVVVRRERGRERERESTERQKQRVVR